MTKLSRSSVYVLTIPITSEAWTLAIVLEPKAHHGSIHDRLSNGRPYKMLTVIDEFTREALTVSIHTKMNGDDVLEELHPLLLKHGTPEYLRSDNGPEFTSHSFQA